MIISGLETPKRAWLRFSLRAAFVVFTVLALAFGFRVNQILARHRAIDAIAALGGSVLYYDEGYELDTQRHGFTAWLAELTGLRHPARADLAGKAVTDEVLLRDVLPLAYLHSVTLDNVSVTDSGLRHLGSLKWLTSLRCIRDPRNKTLLRELARPTYIEVTSTDLPNLFAYLADQHGVKLSLDEQALKAAAIDPGVLITGTVKNKPIDLGDALDEVLGPYQLGWVIDGGTLVVTSRAAAEVNPRAVTIKTLQRALPMLKRIEID